MWVCPAVRSYPLSDSVSPPLRLTGLSPNFSLCHPAIFHCGDTYPVTQIPTRGLGEVKASPIAAKVPCVFSSLKSSVGGGKKQVISGSDGDFCLCQPVAFTGFSYSQVYLRGR